MKRTVERYRGLQMPMAFWLLLIVAALPFGCFLYVSMTAINIELLIVFGIVFSVLLFCLAFICRYRICMNEHGVTAYVGKHRKHFSWNEVRCVHVVRLINGWRVIYVSRSDHPPLLPPYPRHLQTQVMVNAYLQQTIAIGFTRKRLDCISQYSQADVRDMTRS